MHIEYGMCLKVGLSFGKGLKQYEDVMQHDDAVCKTPVREAPKGLSRIGKGVLYYLGTCEFLGLNSFGWTTKHLSSLKRPLQRERSSTNTIYFT